MPNKDSCYLDDLGHVKLSEPCLFDERLEVSIRVEEEVGQASQAPSHARAAFCLKPRRPFMQSSSVGCPFLVISERGSSGQPGQGIVLREGT